jgi:hypothetical protein
MNTKTTQAEACATSGGLQVAGAASWKPRYGDGG